MIDTLVMLATVAPVLGFGSWAMIKLDHLSDAVERLSAVMTQAARPAS